MKHDWLKGKCKDGKVSVYLCTIVGGKRFQVGNVLMNDRFFDTELMARGADAWPVIQREAEAIEATLECASCRERHVLVRGLGRGITLLTARDRLGRFSDYEGCHYSDWFELMSPRASPNRITRFTCQRCGGREVRGSKFT